LSTKICLLVKNLSLEKKDRKKRIRRMGKGSCDIAHIDLERDHSTALDTTEIEKLSGGGGGTASSQGSEELVHHHCHPHEKEDFYAGGEPALSTGPNK